MGGSCTCCLCCPSRSIHWGCQVSRPTAGGTAASSKAAAHPTMHAKYRAGEASRGRRAVGRCVVGLARARAWRGTRGQFFSPWAQNNLIAKVVVAGRAHDDATVSPVVRQTLQHWAYTLNKEDFGAWRRDVKRRALGVSVAFTCHCLSKPDVGAAVYRRSGRAPFAVGGTQGSDKRGVKGGR